MASTTDFSKLNITAELLRQYSDASLCNASELLDEASLLAASSHHARAYFLAVAAIEETGKSLLAFDSQGRNLRDPAVTRKLQKSMEDHQSKIRAAFTGWLMASPVIRDVVMPMIGLMIDLQHGREPSMYTEIRGNTATVQSPTQVVREIAARDCVRLASQCLAYARKHVSETTPRQWTRQEDELFAMKSTEYQKIMNTENFWWYYIAQAESGQKDFSQSVVRYRKEFLLSDKQFQLGPEERRGT